MDVHTHKKKTKIYNIYTPTRVQFSLLFLFVHLVSKWLTRMYYNYTISMVFHTKFYLISIIMVLLIRCPGMDGLWYPFHYSNFLFSFQCAKLRLILKDTQNSICFTSSLYFIYVPWSTIHSPRICFCYSESIKNTLCTRKQTISRVYRLHLWTIFS